MKKTYEKSTRKKIGYCYWSHVCNDDSLNIFAINDYVHYVHTHYSGCRCEWFNFIDNGQSKIWLRFVLRQDDVETQTEVIRFMLKNGLIDVEKGHFRNISLLKITSSKTPVSKRILKRLSDFINLETGVFL